jgi:site-specific DNA recombinase
MLSHPNIVTFHDVGAARAVRPVPHFLRQAQAPAHAVHRRTKSEQIQRLLAVLATADTPRPSVSERLAELESLVGKLNCRLTAIDSKLSVLEHNGIDPDDVARALAQFDELWDVLYPQERSRLVRSLIATITSQASGEVQIALNPGAIRDLALEDAATADPR